GAYSRTRPASEGVVVDAGSSFNAVATRARARLPAPASEIALEAPLRRLWSVPAGALRRELRAFEDLAVDHLAAGGGALADAPPERAAAGFARATLPEHGEPIEAIAHALRADLLPFCHDKRSPDYLAHLD